MERRKSAAVSATRWTAYSAAGVAAAAAGTLTTEAEAGITVVDVNVQLLDATTGDGYFTVFGPYTFGAAGASFGFQQASTSGTAGPSGILLMTGGGSLAIAGGTASSFAYPSNLAYGANLSTQTFGVAAGSRGDMAWRGGYPNSQFTSAASTAYVGFQFDLGGGTQWGWAELTNLTGTSGNTAFFTRYAYGMVGEAITVGQVPEPGSLAALALGAAGLVSMRRRKAA